MHLNELKSTERTKEKKGMFYIQIMISNQLFDGEFFIFRRQIGVRGNILKTFALCRLIYLQRIICSERRRRENWYIFNIRTPRTGRK